MEPIEEKKSVLEEKFDYYVNNPYDLDDYVKNTDELEIVAFYNYIVNQKRLFQDTETKDEKIYTILESQLKNLDVIKRYQAGEIKDEAVAEYCKSFEEELEEIGQVIEDKQNKTPIEKAGHYFRG